MRTWSLLIVSVCCLFVASNWHLNVNEVIIIKVDGSWDLPGNLIWESLDDSVCFVNFSGSGFLLIVLVAVVVKINGLIIWIAGVAVAIDFIVVLFVWVD